MRLRLDGVHQVHELELDALILGSYLLYALTLIASCIKNTGMLFCEAGDVSMSV